MNSGLSLCGGKWTDSDPYWTQSSFTATQHTFMLKCSCASCVTPVAHDITE